MKNFCWLLVLILGSATYGVAQANGGASNRQVWFKSAVELEHTVRSWGLAVDIVERSLYFSTLGALYGNMDIAQLQVLLRGPKQWLCFSS